MLCSLYFLFVFSLQIKCNGRVSHTFVCSLKGGSGLWLSCYKQKERKITHGKMGSEKWEVKKREGKNGMSSEMSGLLDTYMNRHTDGSSTAWGRATRGRTSRLGSVNTWSTGTRTTWVSAVHGGFAVPTFKLLSDEFFHLVALHVIITSSGSLTLAKEIEGYQEGRIPKCAHYLTWSSMELTMGLRAFKAGEVETEFRPWTSSFESRALTKWATAAPENRAHWSSMGGGEGETSVVPRYNIDIPLWCCQGV